MKPIIAIIGNANIEKDIVKQELSENLGKLVIDNNYILATGGLGGVMEYASKGARNSEKYSSNSIIGILPEYDSDNYNKFIDIKIPTGMGIARNTVLISMSSAVIAIGGGSGTLNEISTAWQMNKLIVGLKIDGWSSKLCGEQLDKRRSDRIFCAKDANEAIKLVNENLEKYQELKYLGINKNKTKELDDLFSDISKLNIDKDILIKKFNKYFNI